MRAGGHPRGAVAPGILKLAAHNQPKHMGRVVQDGNPPFPAHGGELPYWLRKQNQTLAQHQQTRCHLVNEIETLWHIQVIQVLGSAGSSATGYAWVRPD